MNDILYKTCFKYVTNIKLYFNKDHYANFTKINDTFISNSNILTDEDLKTYNYELTLSGNVKEEKIDFEGLTKVIKIDLSNLETTNIKNMSRMFYECKSLKNIYFGNINTENVTNMSFMFMSCVSLEFLDIRNFNTKNVKDMNAMFRHCLTLSSLHFDKMLFNTEKVTTMKGMFAFCLKIKVLNMSDWNTRNLKDISNLFFGCKSLNILTLFNTSKTFVNYSHMFNGCRNLKNLGDFENIHPTILDEYKNNR